jgi:hypothetical protein
VTVLTLRRRLGTLLILPALVLAACGGGDDDSGGGEETFDREEFPFTFSYPEGFEVTEDVTVDQALGSQADETLAVGLDQDNILLVQSFTLNIPIDESNLDLAKQEIDALAQQVAPGAESQETEVAGLPAVELEGIEVPTVEDGESKLTAIFDGEQEYFLNCQSTPEQREEIEEACDLALETFALK